MMSVARKYLGRPAGCPPCDSKTQNAAKSWLSLSTGIKATYWLTFCALSIACILYPNEDVDNRIIDDQWMNLRGRIRTDDLFRIFNPNDYALR